MDKPSKPADTVFFLQPLEWALAAFHQFHPSSNSKAELVFSHTNKSLLSPSVVSPPHIPSAFSPAAGWSRENHLPQGLRGGLRWSTPSPDHRDRAEPSLFTLQPSGRR